MNNMNDVRHILGLSQDVIFKLCDSIAQAGEDGYLGLRYLSTPEGQQTLCKIGTLIADRRDHHIKRTLVERRITLKEAIGRCEFDEVDSRIETLFSLPESPDIVRETIPISILCNDYGIELWGGLDKAMAQLKKRSYRPATLGELLALIEHKEYNLGATFALGSVVEKYPNPKLVCYVDEVFSDWDEANRRWRSSTKSLKLANADHLAEVTGEIRNRKEGDSCGKSWVLAVRDFSIT